MVIWAAEKGCHQTNSHISAKADLGLLARIGQLCASYPPLNR